MTYLLGAAQALLAASTWDTNDPGILHAVLSDARQLINRMMEFDPCPMIVFRVNASYPQNWQYSVDSGATWLDGPDTATNYTPQFTPDSGAPGAYDLSVNGGHSSTPFPTLTATDPEALIKDPSSIERNLIDLISTTPEGLAIRALSTIGLQLMQNNGIALALNKIPLFGLATSVLELLAGDGTYTADLLGVQVP